MLQYSMLIQWSDTDNEYIATSPDIPGCQAQGDTYEEAARNGREAIEVYVEHAQENDETHLDCDTEEKVTIESAIENISALAQHIEKILTYPAKSPTRKKVLQSYAQQIKKTLVQLETAIEET
jgi:predicted RNase H-like HicB family nuclease